MTIDRVRQERMVAVLSGDTPLPLKSGPKLVLHVIDLPSLDADVIPISAFPQGPPLPPGRTSSNPRNNIDGLLNYSDERADGDYRIGVAYTQVFRDGMAEGVAVLDGHGTGQFLAGQPMDRSLLTWLHATLTYLGRCDLKGPFAVAIAVVGATGLRLVWDEINSASTIDRDLVLVPVAIVQTSGVESPQKAASMRTALDALWQASGWERYPRKD
jgi:hypothetical protein